MAMLKRLRMTVIIQNNIQEEINCRLNLGIGWNRSNTIQLRIFCCLSIIIKIPYTKTIMLPTILWVWNMISHHKDRPQIRDVWEQGADENNIWTLDIGCNLRQILTLWANQGKWDGQGLWHAWGRWEMLKKCWSKTSWKGITWETDRRVILCWILGNRLWTCELNLPCWGHGPAVGSCEHCNETSGPKQERISWLSELFKKGYAPWSSLCNTIRHKGAN